MTHRGDRGRMRVGFVPTSCDEDEEGYVPSLGVGTASTAGDGDDGTPSSGFTFTEHIYLAFRLGPFALVLGRPD